MKDNIQLFKCVFDFLDHLSEEQLSLLINKKAKLKLELIKEQANESTKEITEIKGEQICIENVCKHIESYMTREEAMEYLYNLQLLKNDLRSIAKHYNIPLGSKETNSQIMEKIIENVVGSKLRFDALLNTDLKG